MSCVLHQVSYPQDKHTPPLIVLDYPTSSCHTVTTHPLFHVRTNIFRYAPVYTEDELSSMPASQLRQRARKRNVSIAGLTDKADVVRALVTTREELLQLPTARLRRLLRERGVATVGLLEKSEYVDAFFKHTSSSPESDCAQGRVHDGKGQAPPPQGQEPVSQV